MRSWPPAPSEPRRVVDIDFGTASEARRRIHLGRHPRSPPPLPSRQLTRGHEAQRHLVDRADRRMFRGCRDGCATRARCGRRAARGYGVGRAAVLRIVRIERAVNRPTPDTRHPAHSGWGRQAVSPTRVTDHTGFTVSRADGASALPPQPSRLAYGSSATYREDSAAFNSCLSRVKLVAHAA